MVEQRSVDIVMVDLLRAGGITPFRKIAGMAEAFNLPVVSHLIPEVQTHTIAAIPNGLTVEYMPWSLRLFDETPDIVDGEIVVPDKSGAGAFVQPGCYRAISKLRDSPPVTPGFLGFPGLTRYWIPAESRRNDVLAQMDFHTDYHGGTITMATYQLRIYTINRGMMDSWLGLFNEHIRPLHDRLGIPVVSSYVNADRNRVHLGAPFSTARSRLPRRKRPTSRRRSGRRWATGPPATSPRWRCG